MTRLPRHTERNIAGSGRCVPPPGTSLLAPLQQCTAIARVHLFARCAHFADGIARQQAEAVKLDTAIEANLKGLGFWEEAP